MTLKAEFDAIVHVGDQDTANSSAYIVESSYAPEESEVKTLLEKVKTFQEFAATCPHFKTVTKAIPVLAGRHWYEKTVNAATAANIWRVAPSGAGYQIIRGLHWMARRCIK